MAAKSVKCAGNFFEKEEQILLNHPQFVSTYDDSFDNTYAFYVFDVPEAWKSDFDKIMTMRGSTVSDEYKQLIRTCFENHRGIEVELSDEYDVSQFRQAPDWEGYFKQIEEQDSI